MSRIKELLNDNESILVFDVDGVLAVMEFGEYNHFIDEDNWNKNLSKNINMYDESKVSYKMQKFLKNKNMDKIYIITKVNDENEIIHKTSFVQKYYNIKTENVYTVNTEKEKVEKIKLIKGKNKEIDDKRIVMIDDTVEILTDIMENTKFSTVHISSLLDI